jgi:hypothetical protein
MYAPTIKLEGADANNVTGTKTFEVPLVPQSAAAKVLPAFTFSFFDPAGGTYRTVSASAIPITVAAAGNPGVPLPRLTATNSAAPPMTDIAHIKVHLGSAIAPAPLLARPWFLLLQGLAPALWIALLVRRKRVEAIANNPRLRRRKEVDALTRKAVLDLRSHAAANQSEQFFATLLRVVQEQIGERLDVPANSVTEAVIDEQLRPRGFPPEACQQLESLFHAANLARYAPVKTAQELTAVADRATGVLAELKQWEPRR